MNALVLNVYEDRVYETELPEEGRLEMYYKTLDCDLIDMVERRIGRKYFTVVCDDEGLFRSDAKISAIDNLGSPMLVGNLMFVKTDEEGKTLGLTRDEINYIKKRIQPMSTRNHPEGYLMLTQCEY